MTTVANMNSFLEEVRNDMLGIVGQIVEELYSDEINPERTCDINPELSLDATWATCEINPELSLDAMRSWLEKLVGGCLFCRFFSPCCCSVY